MSDRWPHKCPECGAPAYVGMNQVECVNRGCKHGSDETMRAWVLSETADVQEPLQREYKGEWVNEEEPPPLTVDTPYDAFNDLDWEEADTHPNFSIPTWFKWFKDFDSKLSEEMKPYGKCWTKRCVAEDAFEVTLYNKPTNLYVSEKFSVEWCCAQHDPAAYLISYVVSNFPRALRQSWEFQRHAEKPMLEAIKSGKMQVDPEVLRHAVIGQTIEEYVITAMDRTTGAFSVKEWL